MQFDSKKNSLRLKRLFESAITEEFKLDERGLLFEIKRIKTSGNPLNRIVAWADLHFLREGSPFCCSEPTCHVPLDSKQIAQISDRIRRCLKLQQPITIDIVKVQAVLHNDVVLDRPGSDTFVPERIDERDQLGRTALWRAATRGYLSQVEELLHSGANTTIPGPFGKTLSDLIAENRLNTSIIVVLEKASDSQSK
jgi:hypothetical protein